MGVGQGCRLKYGVGVGVGVRVTEVGDGVGPTGV